MSRYIIELTRQQQVNMSVSVGALTRSVYDNIWSARCAHWSHSQRNWLTIYLGCTWPCPWTKLGRKDLGTLTFICTNLGWTQLLAGYMYSKHQWAEFLIHAKDTALMLQQVNWLIYIAMKLEHLMRSKVLRTECLPAVCVKGSLDDRWGPPTVPHSQWCAAAWPEYILLSWL